MWSHTLAGGLLALLAQEPVFEPAPEPEREQWQRLTELRQQDLSRYEQAQDDLRETRARLSCIELPVLESARSDPELLWSLLTDPATPEEARLALGLRCGDVLDAVVAARFARARVELERELELHEWGLRRHPLDNRVPPLGPIPHAGETRLVLGRPWQVPSERSAMPFTWAEYREAPWPWRVNEALTALIRKLRSSMRGERAEAWLDACLDLPHGTADDALAFVRATENVRFQSRPAVIACWRAILLAEQGADEVARALVRHLQEAHRLWEDAEGRAMLRVVFEDALRLAHSAEVRSQAAYLLPQLSRPRGLEGKEPAEPAIGALLAACELASDSRHDAWTRLYAFAFSVCEALDEPPITVDRLIRPASPEAEALLAHFLAAVPRLRAELLSRYDHATTGRLRAELERLAPTH